MLRDAAKYGVTEEQPNNQFFTSIIQVYKQDLSESRNQVYRWETIIREGRGWDGGDGYYPENKSFKVKYFPWFPFTEDEGTNVPAGMWMYLHWNGNYLDKEANSIPLYRDQ